MQSLLRFCLVVITISGSASQPSVARGEDIPIGCWNIEHFGRTTDTTSPDHVAAYIQASGVQLLGLEEIYDTDGMSATLTNAKLDAALAKLQTLTGDTWSYRLFPKADNDPAPTEQLTGVVWNTAKLTLMGDPLKIDVAHGAARPNDYWRRQPFASKFSTGTGKTDFLAIVVHMRSNSPAQGQTISAADLRKAEIDSLLGKLPAVQSHFGDQDVVILGDTNVLNASEEAVTKLTSGGFRDLNSTDMKTYMDNGVRTSPFDRFFVPMQTEFTAASQTVFTTFPGSMTQSEFNDDVSDHLLCKTIIQTAADDD